MRSNELINEFFMRERAERRLPNVYYATNVMYSYRDDFPIAAIKGTRAYVLHYDESVSRTTSKHITQALRAAKQHDYVVQNVTRDELNEAIKNIKRGATA